MQQYNKIGIGTFTPAHHGFHKNTSSPEFSVSSTYCSLFQLSSLHMSPKKAFTSNIETELLTLFFFFIVAHISVRLFSMELKKSYLLAFLYITHILFSMELKKSYWLAFLYITHILFSMELKKSYWLAFLYT